MGQTSDDPFLARGENGVTLPMDRPRIVILTGPTASGKTPLAHRLARMLGGEIINADSMQVFRGMDIGTAKPTPEERAEVPYHLLDICDPDEPFDAFSFRVMALSVIRDLHRRRIPTLVVGGTGLYLRVLERGLCPAPGADLALREQWKKEAEKRGPGYLWEELKKVDPLAAERIHPRDTFRLVRALEVWTLTGRPLSSFQRWKEEPLAELSTLWIGLAVEREALYRRINRRTEDMMAQGFLAEVKGLLERGYSPSLKPMQALGYRHLVEVILKGRDLAEAVEAIKRDTRRYAKRQMTWLRKEEKIRWFSSEEFATLEQTIEAFYR